MMREGVGIIILNESGEVLLQHRDEHAPTNPRTWGLWGGRCEEGRESIIACAIRELKEELGIDVLEADLRLCESIEWDFGRGTVRNHIFHLKDRGQFRYVLGEGDDMRFFSADELQEIPLEPSCKLLLKTHLPKLR